MRRTPTAGITVAARCCSRSRESRCVPSHPVHSCEPHRAAGCPASTPASTLQLAVLKDTTDGFAFKSQLADAHVLATATRRAGDGAGESLSFLRLALLHDNLGAYRNAIDA